MRDAPRGPISLPLRLRRQACRIEQRLRSALLRDRTVYVDVRTAEYRGYWAGAANLIGARLIDLTPRIWEIRLGRRTTRVAGYLAGSDGSVTRRIAGDKLLCYRFAQQAQVPVPRHHAFHISEISALTDRVRMSPGEYVIKPLRDSASGLGITLDVRHPRQAKRAAILASLYSDDILLERLVPGESYRLLYLDGKLIHAVRRRGVRVEGDGRRTVNEMARDSFGATFRLGEVELETIGVQGLTPTDVPEPGRVVLLRGRPSHTRVREQRTIYDEAVTHLIGEELDAGLRRVVELVGSSFAGVDIITVDPGRPLEDSGGAFIEINTTPGIHHHYQSASDRLEHPVATAVLRSLLRIPEPVPGSQGSRSARPEPAQLATP